MPDVGCSYSAAMRSSDVLPLPLAPSTSQRSPGRDRERDVVEDRRAAATHHDPVEVEGEGLVRHGGVSLVMRSRSTTRSRVNVMELQCRGSLPPVTARTGHLASARWPRSPSSSAPSARASARAPSPTTTRRRRPPGRSSRHATGPTQAAARLRRGRFASRGRSRRSGQRCRTRGARLQGEVDALRSQVEQIAVQPLRSASGIDRHPGADRVPAAVAIGCRPTCSSTSPPSRRPTAMDDFDAAQQGAGGEPAGGRRQPGRARGRSRSASPAAGAAEAEVVRLQEVEAQAARGRARPQDPRGPARRGAAPARGAGAPAARSRRSGVRRRPAAGRSRRRGGASRRCRRSRRRRTSGAAAPQAAEPRTGGRRAAGGADRRRSRRTARAAADRRRRTRRRRPRRRHATASSARSNGTAYADTWGAPRSGGRSHQGVDMIGRAARRSSPWSSGIGAVQAEQPRRQRGVAQRRQRRPLLLRPPRRLRGIEPRRRRRARSSATSATPATPAARRTSTSRCTPAAARPSTRTRTCATRAAEASAVPGPPARAGRAVRRPARVDRSTDVTGVRRRAGRTRRRCRCRGCGAPSR